jgi:hypothetical protein
MAARRRRPPAATRARGAALIILMALLSMGVLYFIVLQLEAVSQYQKDALQGGGRDSLAQARDALLGYATTYRDTNPNEVMGYLPCPDTTGDGVADTGDPACGSAGNASVGLLPYKTLGLPDLRDSAGGCLWYAVSGGFKATLAKPTPMNWDTQGQFRVRDAGGATLVTPDDALGGAAAVVFAAGPPVAGQSRSAFATEPCRTDPSQVSAHLDGTYNFNTSTAIALTQGPVKDGGGSVTNNDRMAWVTPKEIFDRVVKRQDFSNPLAASPAGQVNKLTDEIRAVLEKKIQDDLVAGTTSNSQPANTASFSQFTGKQIGTLPTTMTLNDGNYTNYYDNWSAGYRQALCSTLSTPCLTVAGTACRGALMFSGRGDGGRPRTAAEQAYSTANLDAYFEAGSGREILNSTASIFAGKTTYSDTNPACAQPASCTEAEKAARRSLDVGTCLFPGEFKSFAQDIAAFAAGVTYSGTQSASVDSGAKTVTLGDNTGGGPGAGCVWHSTPLTLNTSMRLYFRLQYNVKGNGFALALADGATNLAPNYWPRPQIMCGAADSASLGYAGSPSNSTPGIEKPKLGIEFDTLYSASRNDPPGDHMAFVYWGTTTDTDGSDDNTHYLGNGGVAVTGATWAGGTATAATASPHGFAFGQVVLVSGLVPAGYNGTVTITAVPTATQFSYALISNPGASTVGGQAKAVSTGNAPRNPRVATAMRNAPVNVLASDTDPDTGITRTTSWSSSFQRISIVTDVPHGLSAGDQVVVSGIDPPSYNGTYKVLSSGLSTTRPYRFRYSVASDPGTYVSGGTANKVTGTELSSLLWAAATASATTPVAHGLVDGQNITTFGMTPNAYGTTANLTLVNGMQFTYPLADPGGSFSTETPAGMAMVKSTDDHLPYTAGYRFGFPTATTIYVRLDLNRRYDSTNHIAVLDMKAYIGDSFPLADACTPALMQDLSRDLSALCPSRLVTLQQDSIPINALAAISGAAWSAGTVTVTTAAAHGLVSGASVTISGASPTAYNGTFPITVTGATTFTYAVVADPGSYISGGDIQPLSTFYFGFTNGRGSSNGGENQSITIYNLLMRSQ